MMSPTAGPYSASDGLPTILSGANLPPVDFLLLADQLAELYEMVIPEEPDWLEMEGGSYPLWDAENVVWLAEAWREAQPTLDRVHRLLDWQNESPDALAGKLTAVRDVLLVAYYQSQETAVSL